MIIHDLAELESVIGQIPGPMHLKVIDHLDPGALAWIAASPLAFLTFAQGSDIGVTPAGGVEGFASGDAGTLRLPLATIDDAAVARPGMAFGSLFLLPGIGETLRVNGTVATVADGEMTVRVEECYGHCAKALIRSTFWKAEPVSAPADAAGFIAEGRFMALATSDGAGRADLSPKGDPAGAMVQLDGDLMLFADRPGNRRADSFRNIAVQPHIAISLILPGSATVATIGGRAQLTTDADILERFAVDGKIPKIAARVADLSIILAESPALTRAALWPVRPTNARIDPAKMFVEHVKRNKGLMAKAMGAMLSVPGLMQSALDKDYRDNLY